MTDAIINVYPGPPFVTNTNTPVAGAQGNAGWSPVFAVVSNGSGGYVLQIVSWAGGQGTPPSSTNQFIGPSGIVGTAAAAVNILGPAGNTSATAVDYLGAWSGATAYVQSDVVFLSNSFWIALVGNTNSRPIDSNANWKRLADLNITPTKGAYSGATVYTPGDIVTSGGYNWRFNLNTNATAATPATGNNTWTQLGAILPTGTNGQVLTLVAGSWAAANLPGGTTLPAVSGADNGKVLTVVAGAWAAAALPAINNPQRFVCKLTTPYSLSSITLSDNDIVGWAAPTVATTAGDWNAGTGTYTISAPGLYLLGGGLAVYNLQSYYIACQVFFKITIGASTKKIFLRGPFAAQLDLNPGTGIVANEQATLYLPAGATIKISETTTGATANLRVGSSGSGVDGSEAYNVFSIIQL